MTRSTNHDTHTRGLASNKYTHTPPPPTPPGKKKKKLEDTMLLQKRGTNNRTASPRRRQSWKAHRSNPKQQLAHLVVTQSRGLTLTTKDSCFSERRSGSAKPIFAVATNLVDELLRERARPPQNSPMRASRLATQHRGEAAVGSSRGQRRVHASTKRQGKPEAW